MHKWKTLSYSQMGSYTTCAKKYEYEYVDRLRLKKGDVQTSSLGDLVHNGIAAALRAETNRYGAAYQAIKERANKSRHDILTLDGDETPVEDAWNQLAEDAYAITSNVLNELQIGTRYKVQVIEVADPEIYGVYHQVPLVEYPISFPLTADANFSGVVDAVLYDTERQENILFDWKVRGRFTDYNVKVLNGQLPLYQYVLNQLDPTLNITSSVLFQITAKAPQAPALLKNKKGVSRAAITCSWDLYEQTVLYYGFKVEDYEEEMRPKLAAVEFFAPIEITRPQSTLERFWDNAKAFATTIANQHDFPMALGYPCRSCAFARLCTATMVGYGEEEADDYYEVRPDDLSLEED
jgi:hypothetical protein